MGARGEVDWLLHALYCRNELDECLNEIEVQIKVHHGLCEFPLYLKALILRRQGKIQDSLQLFQQTTSLNPSSIENMKQVARSLYLLGKQEAAIEIYNSAKQPGAEDWEIFHGLGLCYMKIGESEAALDNFQHANTIERHDATFLQMGKVYTETKAFSEAIDVYLEALEFSPDNAELLTTVGLLYLRLGESFKAFEYLGNALTHNPRNPKTILAAGSIIQDHNDMEVALTKYRIAAVQTPHSAQLWNNIGMCFFGQAKHVAAISCLKRSLYLDPFEWITAYNLGLVHLNTGQYASAFHYFSSSINMKSDFPSSYMYLGITLSRLDDFENACNAYEKAIEMDDDYLFHLNYAITLCLHDESERAMEHYQKFDTAFQELDAETQQNDLEVVEQRQLLLKSFEL